MKLVYKNIFVHVLFLVLNTKKVACRAMELDYIETYFAKRFDLIKSCENFSTGYNLKLTKAEIAVNEILIKHKKTEFDNAIHNKLPFLPAQHFFKSRDKIRKSEVFKIIQKIPKGASLHTHDTAQVSSEFLFNLTYKNGLYAHVDDSGKIELKFMKTNKNEQWKKIEEFRKNSTTVASFDEKLRNQMTLVVDDPVKSYQDQNAAWEKFEDAFLTVRPLIRYKPVFKQYLLKSFEELSEDNVMYAELRSSLSSVYDLDGKIYNHLEIAEMYLEVLNEFKKSHPNFHGVKVIFATKRNRRKSFGESGVKDLALTKHVARFLEVRKKYPDFIVGFDLVGQEDNGNPLLVFLPYLEYLKKQNVKFFFHAGETNWLGELSDHNLYDAILLNTTRIGHGYAIVKHPRLQEIVKERNIALEISPISNQVLKLVDDIRNHPGAILLANGYPVVITNDDPSFWGAKGLSYDWYMAFMGMASKEADLRLLKQLAINSIVYSSMEAFEKNVALESWTRDWETFIRKMLEN